MDKRYLKSVVRGLYDVQKLRIQTGLRIVVNYKARMGQAPGEREQDLDAEATKLLARLRAHYQKLTDGMVRHPTPKTFQGDEIISGYTELCLVAQYDDLCRHEERHFKLLEQETRLLPLWTGFLKGVKGIGPALTAVFCAEIDIAKARYPSSLWAYCGLDVGPDGLGRSRRKAHLIERPYIDYKGEAQTKQSITFNPFLQAKLLAVLGPSLLRARNPIYVPIYHEYRNRLEHHAKWGTARDGDKSVPWLERTSKMRRHRMAIRYMVKMFLIDLHKAWRSMEGLPVSEPYHVAKLGYDHRPGRAVG